jgi:hypothetical protein
VGVADTEADAELLLDLNIETQRASVPERPVAILANALPVSGEVGLWEVDRQLLKGPLTVIIGSLLSRIQKGTGDSQ